LEPLAWHWGHWPGRLVNRVRGKCLFSGREDHGVEARARERERERERARARERECMRVSVWGREGGGPMVSSRS